MESPLRVLPMESQVGGGSSWWNLGDPYTLGYNYQHGIEVEKDEHKAFVYYQKSADIGNAKGIYQVGECYYYGTGVEKDEHKIFIYYQKSAILAEYLMLGKRNWS
ncbi:hypothetical protein C2G38_2235094 [Gigaspora rosea]|uniref:Uncharacterized protein n=1 Tax=Gigaspora rosea TaxID=44941 RepID=A0A397TPW3_9GLOM|nr:hypothetical protein C2G38_2235094 [Gigaspora rosea]